MGVEPQAVPYDDNLQRGLLLSCRNRGIPALLHRLVRP